MEREMEKTAEHGLHGQIELDVATSFMLPQGTSRGSDFDFACVKS